jgi:putative hydrolase of the HAD superfamily
MSRYQAILFDLFDTLIDFRVERFPLVRFRNAVHHSTGEIVYQTLQHHYPHISFELFYESFFQTYKNLDERRNRTRREIPAHERFREMLIRVGIDSPPDVIVEELVRVHMEQLFQAMTFPSSRRTVLETLRPRYRLGIVSNFDNPPTARRALNHYDLTPFFDPIVISGEIGWRKPHAEIFLAALHGLGVSAEQVLFVGDTPWADIVGAKEIGMDVVWIDHRVTPFDPGFPPPNVTIGDFEEILSVIHED